MTKEKITVTNALLDSIAPDVDFNAAEAAPTPEPTPGPTPTTQQPT